jgi:hypothetical protein
MWSRYTPKKHSGLLDQQGIEKAKRPAMIPDCEAVLLPVYKVFGYPVDLLPCFLVYSLACLPF